MKLYPEGMAAPVAVPIVVTSKAKAGAVKAAVKAFVKSPQEYDAIIKHVESTVGLSGIVDIVALIDEVRNEWHPVAIEAEPVAVEK